MPNITTEELKILTEAKETKDWTVLKTAKLRYLYQRFIALPGKDMEAFFNIAAQARMEIFS